MKEGLKGCNRKKNLKPTSWTTRKQDNKYPELHLTYYTLWNSIIRALYVYYIIVLLPLPITFNQGISKHHRIIKALTYSLKQINSCFVIAVINKTFLLLPSTLIPTLASTTSLWLGNSIPQIISMCNWCSAHSSFSSSLGLKKVAALF